MWTSPPRAFHSAILILAACLAPACAGSPAEEETQDGDTAVEVCPRESEDPPRSVALGTAGDDGFTPFQPGDALPIIDGLQGGTWVMPAAVFRVPSLRGDLDAAVRLSTGETLGAIESVPTKLTPSEGGGELPYIPIPIGQSTGQPTAEAADGQPGEIHVLFEDACAFVTEVTLPVTLKYDRADSP